MNGPPVRIRWWITLSFAAMLSAGLVSLALVAAAPLGLVDPYPEAPPDYVDGPLGLSRPIDRVDSLQRQGTEPMQEYLARLAASIADGTVHYWHHGESWQPTDAPHTRVSPWVNYLLWLEGDHPQVGEFRSRYEFLTPSLALARGHGVCSQWSRVAYSILRDQGIEATIMQNDGHVVVETQGVVLDAAYGVVVPRPLQRISEDPESIVGAYARFPAQRPLLLEVYGRPWRSAATHAEFDLIRRHEERAERLKWVPPSAIAVIGLLGLVLVHRSRAPLGSPGSIGRGA